MAECLSEQIWNGSTSAKFTTNRRNIVAPEAKAGKHPIFNMGGKCHFDEPRSETYVFRPHPK